MHLADEGIGRIETGLGDMLLLEVGPMAAPLQRAERDDHVFRQPKDFRHIAQRAARPIGNHRRRETGAFAAVFFVNVLDDFLAPLMFEIDVDVRRLLTRGRDEAGEKKIVFRRVDGGDSEHVADRRIGRRAPPLTQDFLFPREIDDVVDGEEIGRVIELFDQAPVPAAISARTFGGAPCG